ncbi:MAG: sugar phosphate isomerase/epimerase [Candidatus Promineifilaceae bacterium]|nr:sugar phosphate isomerase/epimerase [Candidatus Promineifilaceae bacterium]
MLQVGIFSGYFPYSLEESAKTIRDLGFNTVQLDLIFSDMDLATESITKEKCVKIRDTFRRYNLPVSCISSYTNLVDPVPERRKMNLDRLKTIIRHCHDLGSPYVPSETGTYHLDSDWIDHPKNHTEEGYEECRDIIYELVQLCRQEGAVFVIEAYIYNVIGTVEKTLRLFSEINDPQHLALAMDPVNYIDEVNFFEQEQTLNYMFDALGDTVVFAHAKDINVVEEEQDVQMAEVTATEGHSFRGVGKIEQPACGLGKLNYDVYLQRLAKVSPNCPIIIEHLELEDVPRAKKWLDGKLMVNGA